MANKDTSKLWFETGDYPTQQQFAQVFDWLRWTDEGIGIGDVENLQNILNILQVTLNQAIPNLLISGGLVYIVSDDGTNVIVGIPATTYTYRNVDRYCDAQTVTITRPASAELYRFDVFYLDATGFHVLTGNEAETPIKPQLLAGLELTTILVGFDNALVIDPMPGTPNLQAVTLAGIETTLPVISKDSLQIGQLSTMFKVVLKASLLTALRTQQYQDKDGIIALLSDLQQFEIKGEYENNTTALADGLVPGDRYTLPMENDRVIVAMVKEAVVEEGLIFEFTSDVLGSLPFSDAATFQSFFATDNPGLVIDDYVVVGDKVKVYGDNFKVIKYAAFAPYGFIFKTVNTHTIERIKGGGLNNSIITLGIFPNVLRVDNSALSYSTMKNINLPACTYLETSGIGANPETESIMAPVATTVGGTCISDIPKLNYLSFDALTYLDQIFYETASSTALQEGGVIYNFPSLETITGVVNPFQVLIAYSGAYFYNLTIKVPTAMVSNADIQACATAGATIIGL